MIGLTPGVTTPNASNVIRDLTRHQTLLQSLKEGTEASSKKVPEETAGFQSSQSESSFGSIAKRADILAAGGDISSHVWRLQSQAY